jgi:subtilase family serine protease
LRTLHVQGFTGTGVSIAVIDTGFPTVNTGSAFARINKSAKRLAMPEIPEHVFMDGLKALIDIDRNWVPKGEGKDSR